MNEHIELPLNKKPYIRSNISRAGLFSVATSDAYAGTTNAEVERFALVCGGQQTDLLVSSDCYKENMQTEYLENERKLRFSSHPYEEQKKAYVWSRIEEEQFYCVEVSFSFLQDSNVCSCARLVLSDGLYTEGKGITYELSKIVMVTVAANKRIIVHAPMLKKPIQHLELEWKERVAVRIAVRQQMEISYSLEGGAWKTLVCLETVDRKYVEAGILVEPKINPFFYEFFLSHIQLCCTKDTIIAAPHFEGYERNYPMLECRQIPMNLLDISKESFLDMLIRMLKKGYYINLGLNEFYLPDRSSYQKQNHVHVNFLYGVDLEEKYFMVMGFDRVLKYSRVPFKEFFQAVQREVSVFAKINLYRYVSKAYLRPFPIQQAVCMLKAYREGAGQVIVASDRLVSCLDDNLWFGIDIYKNIIEEKKIRTRVVQDIRISYQLYEHDLIMREFLHFLVRIKTLCEEQIASVDKQYGEIETLHKKIQAVILKNRIKPRESTEEKICGYYQIMLKMQYKVINTLVELLDGTENKGN